MHEGSKQWPNWADAARSGCLHVLQAPQRSRIKRAARRGSTTGEIIHYVNHIRDQTVIMSTIYCMVKGSMHDCSRPDRAPRARARRASFRRLAGCLPRTVKASQPYIMHIHVSHMIIMCESNHVC